VTGKPTPSAVAMNRDQIWQAIDVQRTNLTDLLEHLADDEWLQPSLCAGWTVRDVAAHLTLQQLSPGATLGMMLKWRGNLDRTIQHAARLRAGTLTTRQIIAQIRGMIGSRRHTFGVTYLETLTDILVHSQDIALPLGRRLTVPPDAAAAAASRVLSMRWPPPPPSARKITAVRLTATDTSWSAGDGPEVRAPMAVLLLLCCGRLAVLPQLCGEAAPDLARRLSEPTTPA
jgi:uncharacterized protein (TIGR03083 family)